MNDIAAIREDLKRAAAHEPEHTQNMLATLDKQLKGWAKGVTRDLCPSSQSSVRRD